MTSRRKTVVLVAAALLLLLLGIQLGWVLRGAPPGMAPLLDLLAQLQAKPATDADWKALTVRKSAAAISGLEMLMVTVTNLFPVLEAERDTSARQIGVLNTRKEDMLRTMIWGHKANNTLEFDWLAGTCTRVTRPAKNPAFFHCPNSSPMYVRWTGKYLIGKPSRSNVLTICTPRGKREFPWERPTMTGEPFFHENYRYGVAPEADRNTGRAIGIVIYDLEKLEVAGLVSVPPQVAHYHPLFVLDPSTDLLLCFELDLAWIVCIDLRPGIDQSKKPWPPPWPHPALGPWDGRGQPDKGIDTQLPPGKPVPPKPPDYPQP